MSKAKQLILSETLKAKDKHGGEVAQGKRKAARPVALKRSMHLVLRATAAVGKYSLLRPENTRIVERVLKETSKAYSIRVYEFSNVGIDLHLLIRASTREGFKNFLRVLAGRIAQQVTGARRGKPWGTRFWGLLAFSRIVEWGKAFAIVSRYVVQNRLEAAGLIPHQPREIRSAKGQGS